MIAGSRPLSLAISIVLLLEAVPLEAARKRARRRPSNVENDSSVTRILSAENQRITQDPFISAGLQHPNPRTQKAAILAAGRIGDASLLGELSNLLNRRRSAFKKEAAFALGLYSDPMALTIAVQHLAMQKDPEILGELYKSVGRAGGEKQVELLAQALHESGHPKILAGICQGLGQLWAKESEAWKVPPGLHLQLIQRASADSLAVPCTFALSRFKGSPSFFPVPELVKLGATLRSQEATVFVLRALARVSNPTASTLLVQTSGPQSPPAIRIEALKSLSGQRFSPLVLVSLQKALDGPAAGVIFQAMETLEGFGAEASESSETLQKLYAKTSSLWLRGQALKTGFAVDKKTWESRVLQELNNPQSPLRNAAASAFLSQSGPNEQNRVVSLIQDPSLKLSTVVVEQLNNWPEESFTLGMRAALQSALSRKDPALLSAIASIVERFQWKDFGPTLQALYPELSKPDFVESRVAILSALTALKSTGSTAVLESALSDNERSVVTTAVEGLREIANRDESGKIPLNSKPAPFSFTSSELATAGAKVTFRTTRGTFTLRLRSDTPLTSIHFQRLVKKKFYDGLDFHRVIPGFVAQGGDPRGDGFGGPGFLIRDELTPASHLRATVGIATSGKDTGGSQFFINLGTNLHLDARYTIFADVMNGLDVVERIEGGDKILSARVEG